MNPISLVVLGALGFLVFFWLRALPKKRRVPAVIMIVLVLAALFLILMALTGRLHWLAGVVAALLPFARNLFPLLLRLFPVFRYLFKQRQRQHQASGNRSKVETKILEMELDHDSGVMYGQVKTGPLKGCALGELSEQQFLQLLNYCRREDVESARLLETYLDKRFGDSWREDDNPEQAQPSSAGEQMDVAKAYKILGLSPGCSREEIVEAHRKLMQKNHPDRGGSDFLAAQINQAKDLLLKLVR